MATSRPNSAEPDKDNLRIESNENEKSLSFDRSTLSVGDFEAIFRPTRTDLYEWHTKSI